MYVPGPWKTFLVEEVLKKGGEMSWLLFFFFLGCILCLLMSCISTIHGREGGRILSAFWENIFYLLGLIACMTWMALLSSLLESAYPLSI